MKKDLEQSLVVIIEDSLGKLGLEKGCAGDLYLDFPTDTRFGDLSTNIALRISKIVKKPPLSIARDLVGIIKESLKDSLVNDYIKEVSAEGAGFINFYLEHKYFYQQLKCLILKGEKSQALTVGKGERVLIEFVSANPTGPLSVAHARQAVVGDCLANILEFLGFKVKREYYLNDEGNQIDILAESVRLRIKELGGENIEFPENYYQGEYIYEIAKKVQGQKIKDEEVSDFAVEYILKTIKEDLKEFKVRFDYWFSQKQLGRSREIARTLDLLKKKGFLYEKDGALWFKSTDLGDDKDRVVIKSDGAYTYLAPDIAYHRGKYKRRFKWLINLWGPDHHGYIKRLKAAVQSLGHAGSTLSIIIVQLASIFKEGKPLEMSTRRGQYITLREVLDEVGSDAARFFFLMRKTSSHLDFDLDTAKKQTSENPVYYVQYAHARICSILRQSHIENFKKNADLSLLKEREEIALIKKTLQFSYILNICHKTQDPYMLTVYLQELAETFHRFYDLHKVLGEDDRLTKARLSLIEAARIIINSGLRLLGVSTPEKM
ncbi:MAG: arginine--tRNA ligase [Candidatus Omnitrophica bacterium]|nr:arginine--tRNA ligase [Candidatus Omnitrophota bacterium]MBU1905609.1 arginine--tRNA ligase [Candidatus Omnitrophota bacterium]